MHDKTLERPALCGPDGQARDGSVALEEDYKACSRACSQDDDASVALKTGMRRAHTQFAFRKRKRARQAENPSQRHAAHVRALLIGATQACRPEASKMLQALDSKPVLQMPISSCCAATSCRSCRCCCRSWTRCYSRPFSRQPRYLSPAAVGAAVRSIAAGAPTFAAADLSCCCRSFCA